MLRLLGERLLRNLYTQAVAETIPDNIEELSESLTPPNASWKVYWSNLSLSLDSAHAFSGKCIQCSYDKVIGGGSDPYATDLVLEFTSPIDIRNHNRISFLHLLDASRPGFRGDSVIYIDSDYGYPYGSHFKKEFVTAPGIGTEFYSRKDWDLLTNFEYWDWGGETVDQVLSHIKAIRIVSLLDPLILQSIVGQRMFIDTLFFYKPSPVCEGIMSQSECEAAGCSWYNGACHAAPPNCSELTTQADCEACGCYWYNNACHANPKPGLVHFYVNGTDYAQCTLVNIDTGWIETVSIPATFGLSDGNYKFVALDMANANFDHWEIDGIRYDTKEVGPFNIVAGVDITATAFYVTITPECSVDADCQSGYKCVNRKCVKEVTPPPSQPPLWQPGDFMERLRLRLLQERRRLGLTF